MDKDTSLSLKEKIYHDNVSILNISASNAREFTLVKATLRKLISHIESHILIKLNKEKMEVTCYEPHGATEHCTQTQKNTHTSQHLKELSPKLTT